MIYICSFFVLIIITLPLLIIIMTILIIMIIFLIIIIIVTIIFIASLDFFLLITSQVLHILSIISALGYWCFNNALLSDELIRNASIFLKYNMYLSVDFSQQLLLIALPRCSFASCIVIVVVEMLRYLMSYINKYYENIGADRRVENIRDDTKSDTIGSSSASSSSSGNRLQQQQTSNNADDHDDDNDINEDNDDGDKDDVDDVNDVDHKDHHDDHNDYHDDRGGEKKKDKRELDVGEDRSSFQFAFVLECLLKILSSVASTVMLLLRPYYAMIFVTVMIHGVM